MAKMQKIIPNLWFNSNAEEAVKFYTSIFKNSKIGKISHYTKSTEEVSGKPAGTVLTMEFQLDGQDFVALNGGPEFKFTEAISFIVNCETQEEIDHYWKKLSEGGDEKAQICGWLKDKYGASWQIVPAALGEMIQKNPEKVMEALLKMKKLDINALKKAGGM